MDRFTFGWIADIIYRGFSSKDASVLTSSFQEEFGLSHAFENDQLLNDMLHRHRNTIIGAASLKLLSEILTVYSVDVMKQAAVQIKLISMWEFASWSQLYLKLALLLTLQLFNTLCMNHHEFLMCRTGLSCSKTLSYQLFSHLLSRRTINKQDDNGHLVNMMTVDAHRVEHMFSNMHYIWSAPLQCTLIFWSLYGLIGNAALIGFIIMLAYIPLQYSTTLILKNQRKV